MVGNGECNVTSNVTVTECNATDKIREDKNRIDKNNNTILLADETPTSQKDPVSQSSPVAISITLNDKSEYPITEADVAGWKELYPAVDVLQELRKMKGWADANPTKRKTKSGIKRFINSWLSKEQDRYRQPIEYARNNGGREGRQPEHWDDMPWDKK